MPKLYHYRDLLCGSKTQFALDCDLPVPALGAILRVMGDRHTDQ